MRIDLTPIHREATALLAAIERRDATEARRSAESLLSGLPPDDFADPAPGLTICTSTAEYAFRGVLPYLRGTARKWDGWLEDARGDWPEPVQLRSVLQALEGIRVQLGTAEAATEPAP